MSCSQDQILESCRDSGLTVMEIYSRLYSRYGAQGWWPSENPYEVIVGAILTQGVSWINAEKALINMKEAGCWDLLSLNEILHAELADLIRPSLYYNNKSVTLKAFAEYVCLNHDSDLVCFFDNGCVYIRESLLKIRGIGPETADDIMVYAAGCPSFVVDAYTHRILTRLGLVDVNSTGDYYWMQKLFHACVPHDIEIFNEYHALLDQHGKTVCTRNAPNCKECCLSDMCAYHINDLISEAR